MTLSGAISRLKCHLQKWSHEQLENEIAFNIETKLALGLKGIESIPFSMRTIYNFMNRLSSYEARTRIDLIEQVFLKLTKKQLKAFGIKTTIQRGDSVLLESSIRSYSRSLSGSTPSIIWHPG